MRPRALIGAIAIFVPLTLLVAGHLEPFPGEVGLVEWVNGWPRPLGVVLQAIMPLGTLWGALIVFVVVTVTVGRHRRRALLALALAIATGFVVDDVVKAVIERPRPSVVLTTTTVRDDPGGTAYPSGHTTMAFAVAVALLALLPARWRPMALVLAAGVGVSRMYVGVHWPTDIVGGAALGTILALLCWLVVRPGPAPGATAGGEYRAGHP